MKKLGGNEGVRARGSIMGVAVAGFALVAAGGALVFSYVTSVSVETSSVRVRLTANSARAWIVRAGLDPRSLVAAGFTAQDATLIVGHAVEFLAEHTLEMREVESQLADARKALPRLENAAIAGEPAPGAAKALTQGRSLISSLEAQVRDFEAAVFAAGTNGLDQGKVARVASIKASRTSGLPLEFRLQARSDEEIVALRDALAARDIATRAGSEPSDAASQIITSASTPDCNEAASRLGNCAAVTTAWNAAVGEAEGR
jgi:hypothetical protein